MVRTAKSAPYLGNVGLVVYILGLAIFAIGTSELMVAGMMTTLSETFNITIGEVGHLISYFAFGVMVGGLYSLIFS